MSFEFRAWDGSEMVYSKSDTSLSNIQDLSIFFSILRRGEVELGRDYILMKYTGQKDCEDTKIFNGDIIEMDTGYRNYIIYRGTGYQYKGIDEAHGFDWWKIMSRGKVIGNVCENLELIKTSGMLRNIMLNGG